MSAPAASEFDSTSRPARILRSDVVLLVLALASAALFFGWLAARLWPLARMPLDVPARELRAKAQNHFAALGRDLNGFSTATHLTFDEPALDYVETELGQERAQRMIETGSPLYFYRVAFKRRGDPSTAAAMVHPSRGVIGWERALQDDEAGVRLDTAAALARIALVVRSRLGIEMERWQRMGWASTEREARRDHRLVLERQPDGLRGPRERLEIILAGDEVASVRPSIVVPPAFSRKLRAQGAGAEALGSIGMALLAAGCLVAFVHFLLGLRRGTADLPLAGLVAAAIFLCLLLVRSLRYAGLFEAWDPLWPFWIANLKTLVQASLYHLLPAILILAFIAAGESLDREAGGDRMASLRAFFTGRWGDPRVGAASARGFLIGFLCGAALSTVVWLFAASGARTAIQPRGFFFYGINSLAPSISLLVFFLQIALLEEGGYRLFGTTFFLRVLKSRPLAMAIPALVFGLNHTTLAFIPPADPAWGRAAAMATVGLVWAWAFLRYDMLTVVLSHWAADLFIFSWPRLASDHPGIVARAILTFCVPLLPALVFVLVRVWRRATCPRPS